MKRLFLLLVAALFVIGSWAQGALTPQNATRWYAEYKNYFEDDICTQLKPAYKVMSDEQLRTAMNGFPEELIGFALKAKNDAWDSFEKDFRVQKFKPYSNSYRWTKYMNVYQYSDLQNPTGIIGSNEYIYVFVSGNVPEDVFMYIDVVPDNGSYALTDHKINAGLNVFKLADTEGERRMMFLDYKVDTDTTATSKKLSDYPEVSLHIEGGHVYGYFDAARHDNAFWQEMLERQANDTIAATYKGIQAKGERVLFQMFRSSLANACPEKITEALALWDETVKRQHLLMGAEQYYDRWNDLIMARSDNRGGGFYASPTFTYYDDYALSGMLSWDEISDSPGILWTAAHEIGHVNQGAINMVGCTESSNNLFANMNIHMFGKTTTRGDGVAFCREAFSNKTPFPARCGNPIGVARMYFQLYLYFHVAENDVTFYPRLFEALRKDPLLKEYITYGRKDQLKFAEKCCEIAQMDLSEFFEAWGFFEPMESLNIGDYATYLVTLTQEEIDESRARMQQYEKKGGHLMFIEDRIKPSKRSDGVDGYRLDFNDTYAIGKMGSTGQWIDYKNESIKAQGYYYSRISNNITIKAEEGAKGALGFKLYNAETGELLDFNNGYRLTVPVAQVNAPLRVVAAQADGTDCVLADVSESDDPAMLLEALNAALSTVKNLTSKTTTTGKEIGYFYKSALTNINALYKEAKAAADNADQSEHTYKEWIALLEKEMAALKNDPTARAYLKQLDVYTITNTGNRSYGLCYDEYGLVGKTAQEMANTSPNKHWMFETTGVSHHYYIKNKNGKYINDITEVGTSCSGNDQSSALVFKAHYLDNGTVYFTTAEGVYLTLDLVDYDIVGGRELVDAATWGIRAVELNNTAIEEVNNEAKMENIKLKGIYDLQGRKVEAPSKGLYIVDGKKVFVK